MNGNMTKAQFIEQCADKIEELHEKRHKAMAPGNKGAVPQLNWGKWATFFQTILPLLFDMFSKES